MDECPKGGSHSWVDRYTYSKSGRPNLIGTQCSKRGTWK